MEVVIESLRSLVATKSIIAKTLANDKELIADIKALVDAINVLETRIYGETKTKLKDFGIK